MLLSTSVLASSYERVSTVPIKLIQIRNNIDMGLHITVTRTVIPHTKEYEDIRVSTVIAFTFRF